MEELIVIERKMFFTKANKEYFQYFFNWLKLKRLKRKENNKK